MTDPFEQLIRDMDGGEEKPYVDAKVTFTDKYRVDILFESVHVMDIDSLFAMLGTEQGRNDLMAGIARGLARRVLDQPVPYSLVREEND